MTRVAVWAESRLETVVAVVGALAAGVPSCPINPKVGRARAASTSCPTAPPTLSCSDDVDLAARGAWPDEPGCARRRRSSSTRRGRPGRRRASCCPRRALASNLDALAERLGVDRRGRGRARAAAVPRARAGPRRARAAAPRRRGLAPRPLLARGGGGGAGRAGDDAVRRPDDVPPARRRRRGDRGRGGLRRARGCWSPARRRCRPPTTRGSSALTRPADRRALRHDRDADEHGGAGRRRAPRRARSGAPLDGVELRLVDDDGDVLDASDDETLGRDPGARAEPLPRVPQPRGRHGRGAARRLVPHRRPGHARGRRLHPASSAGGPPT